MDLQAVVSFFFEQLKRFWGSTLATASVYILVGVQKYLRWHDFVTFQNFGSVFSPWRLSETIDFVILTVPTLARVQKPSWKLRKTQNQNFLTISAHQRPIDTCSDVIPTPRSACVSNEKYHRLLTSQTANSSTPKGMLLQTVRTGIFRYSPIFEATYLRAQEELEARTTCVGKAWTWSSRKIKKFEKNIFSKQKLWSNK